MSKQTIITFSGKAQHGKDSSADILKRLLESKGHRVLRVNMADKLKFIARQYMGWDGKKDERGRTILQLLGTEKIRAIFPNYWVDNAISIARIFEDDYEYILVGDCRFPNEIHRWVSEGYHVVPIHVKRTNFDNGLTEEQQKHKSETALDEYRFFVYLTAKNLIELENEIITKVMPLLEGGVE
jgi:hypothetical protein